MKKPFSIGKFLYIYYLGLPENLKEKIREHHSFGNDRILRFYSEFEPKDITLENLIKYFNEAVEFQEFPADQTFEQFIEEYGLQIEKWIADNKIDLSEVDDILIDVCW